MKFPFTVIMMLLFSVACQRKDSTEDELKNAMQVYLYNGIHNDSSNVKYHVNSVIYYDDKIKNKYICVFTVHLKEKLFDTTGEMKAYISKDFKKVERLY